MKVLKSKLMILTMCLLSMICFVFGLVSFNGMTTASAETYALLDETNFLVYGASVRAPSANTGNKAAIRFHVLVSDSFYDTYVADNETNVISVNVMVKKYLGENENVLTTSNPTVKTLDITSEWLDCEYKAGYKEAIAYFYGIPEAYFNYELAVAAKMSAVTSGNNTVTYVTNQQSASLAGVAYAAVNNFNASSEVYSTYYEGQTCTVTLDANGGTLANDSVTLAVGEQIPADVVPVKEGYTFAYWAKEGSRNEFKTALADAKVWAVYTRTLTQADVDNNTFSSAIDADLSAIYYLGEDLDFTGKTVNADDTLRSIGWTSNSKDDITKSNAFTGVFDGNGYAIKNLSMKGFNGTSAIGSCLFAYVNGGTIKNLKADLSVPNVGNSHKYVGLVGLMVDGVIDNCCSELETKLPTYQNASGLAAPLVSYLHGGTITNCIGIYDLTAYAGGVEYLVGGLVGNINQQNNIKLSNNICVVLQSSGNYATYNWRSNESRRSVVAGTAYKTTVSYVVSNVNKYSDIEAMFKAENENIVAANGWNKNWSISNGLIKFSDEVVCEYVETLDKVLYSLKDANGITVSGLNGTVNSVLYNGSEQVSVCDTSTSGAITIPNAVLSALPLGEQMVTIATNNFKYNLPFTVATDVITTPTEFWDIEKNMAGYYVLGQNIDFKDETPREGIGFVAGKDFGANCNHFKGTLDGNGFMLLNYTTKTAHHASNVFGNYVFAAVYGGTIKNLGANITLVAANANVRDSGLIGTLNDSAVVENCYITFKTNSCAYTARGVGAIAGYALNSTIRNVVAVLDITGLNKNNGSNQNGGLGFYGNIACQAGGTNSPLNIQNSFGVLLKSDNKRASQLICNGQTAVIDDLSFACDSMADVFDKKANITGANGWNMNIWKVTATGITFGAGEKPATVYSTVA